MLLIIIVMCNVTLLNSQGDSPQATNFNDGRKLILHEMKFTGTEISRGAYGRVLEVEYGGALCAVREIHSLSIFTQGDDKASDEALQDNFMKKCQIWSTLHHPCIIQFIG